MDSQGIEKPLWFALRRAFAPRLATVQPLQPGPTHDPTGHQGLTLALVNDSGTDWRPDVLARRIGFDGRERAGTRLRLDCPAGGLHRVPLDPAIGSPADPAAEILVVDVEGNRTTWTYRPDRELTQGRPRRRVDLAVADGEPHVSVTALTVLRDLCVFAERVGPAGPIGYGVARRGGPIDRGAAACRHPAMSFAASGA
ncbi:hypothetical protein [Streptomyces sp. NBC_01190]|uniref:hypothetical protein n=1 Tax=Streptomyces sp. NBC_01190 TaxID=2903767 RepID=UPI00386CCCF9|nr:hypothetical protein OG519_00400 [Streptomyces sp. NBC_01190]